MGAVGLQINPELIDIYVLRVKTAGSLDGLLTSLLTIFNGTLLPAIVEEL